MSYFRSETMSYYQIVVPRESAWEVYNALGKIDAVFDKKDIPDRVCRYDSRRAIID